MNDPRSFGSWLRRERERRNITIRAIADRTKIGAALLEALERGDVSRWPAGIYRRAFIKGYADAVGLDTELVLANFERLFPAPDAAPAPQEPAAAPARVEQGTGQQGEMRLQLADMGPRVNRAALRDLSIQLAIVVAMALVGFVAVGWLGFWAAAAVAAVVQHVHVMLREIRRAPATPARAGQAQAPRPLAPVVNFSDEPARLTSRRARARRMAATLSAVAIPAASFRRRRAARS
jgi:transcriptional regulator with XRE-family HTH domain